MAMGSSQNSSRREVQPRGAEKHEGLSIALFTQIPDLMRRFEEHFRPSKKPPGAYIVDGPDCLHLVRDVLEPLSPEGRRAVRGVLVGEDGRFEPWSAVPVETLLLRLETPWLTEMLAKESVRFEYQPIVNARTGLVFAFKALMRSSHESARQVGPLEIIAAAKAHGRTLDLDAMCRRQAVIQGLHHLEPHEHFVLNFLPMAVCDSAFCVKGTVKVAESLGFDPARLIFEMSVAHELPDLDFLRTMIQTYRRLGVKIGMSDVSTANAPLGLIDRIEPDFIKVDQRLVKKAATSRKFAIIHGIFRLAQERGIKVIAERLETEMEYQLVRLLDVDYLQGFLIGRPEAIPNRSVRLPWRAAG